MEILKIVLNNSDAIVLSVFGCFIYDKLKSHSNATKSDFDCDCKDCNHKKISK